ncbi:DUF4360 domain-containing protein [Pseudonocardiaceae bacterium YIM PH 21723]|nr:DUF4360 domain-containing protein [Pseudonocardiaceae bacterium YIM PH 21723]
MAPLFAVAGLVLSLAQPVTAAAIDAPPPGSITVNVVTVNGSGCRPGTATVAVSGDRKSFTVTYSEYLAKAGRGTTSTDRRKDCQLNLEVHVPEGHTYAIQKVDYRGFASLTRGASGNLDASYYFAGLSPTQQRGHRLTGPKSDNWQFTDQSDIETMIYKPCGEDRNFNIKTALRANARQTAEQSFLSIDSTDVDFSSRYYFAWKRC